MLSHHLGDDDEERKLEVRKAEREPSTRLRKKLLGVKVEKVVGEFALGRLAFSFRATSEYDRSAGVEHIVEARALRDSSLISDRVAVSNLSKGCAVQRCEKSMIRVEACHRGGCGLRCENKKKNVKEREVEFEPSTKLMKGGVTTR
jgi:hypothetical protein